MGLKIKNASEILKNAITYVTHTTKKITDFSVGSVVRTLLESVSLQLEELYFKMYDAISYAIENSIFNAFGFSIIPEEYASGDVTLEFKNVLTSEINFPAGLTFCTSSSIGAVKYYRLAKDVIAPIGSSKIILPVICTVAGVTGNTTENSINIMVTANTLVSKVYNELPFTNGRAAETKAERKARFKKFISNLVRGTAGSIEYAASTVSGITGVYVDDSNIGLVKVYCHDTNGDLSDTLKQAVKAAVDEYRSAGVEVEILPVIKSLIDVEVNVILNQDYDPELYKTTISTAISTYMYEFQVNQAFYITSLIKYLMNLDDLAVVDVEVIEPATKIPASTQVLLRPGTIKVTTETVGN
jgi:hypothetical protein